MISIYTIEYKVLGNGPHHELIVHQANDEEGAREKFWDKLIGQKQWVTIEKVLETKDEAGHGN